MLVRSISAKVAVGKKFFILSFRKPYDSGARIYIESLGAFIADPQDHAVKCVIFCNAIGQVTDNLNYDVTIDE